MFTDYLLALMIGLIGTIGFLILIAVPVRASLITKYPFSSSLFVNDSNLDPLRD
jgi:hypothetical protein